LGHDSSFDLALNLLTFWRNGIDLVDEYYRWFGFFSLGENLTKFLFTLPIIFAHDLRAIYGQEVRTGFICNSPGYERLSGPRRAMEEDTFWRPDTETFEQFRMFER
jgi:hypothetical protein